MNLDVALVPHGQLTRVIPTITQHLVKSELWTGGRASIDDIVGFLYQGRMNLWLVYEPTSFESYGYVITEVKDYPKSKMLVCQYTAGRTNHMRYVEDKIHAILESFARDAGCAGIEFYGRPGWQPHARKHGYQSKAIVYEKFFGGES